MPRTGNRTIPNGSTRIAFPWVSGLAVAGNPIAGIALGVIMGSILWVGVGIVARIIVP